MLLGVIDCDISHGFAEIQKWIDMEHDWSRALGTERNSLAERVKTLEARVAGLETEHTSLQSGVQTLHWATLEKEVQTEWELSGSVVLATWGGDGSS